MSDATENEEPHPVKKVIRTVSPSTGYRPDAEMDSIGWMLFLGLVILIVPLLPFLVIIWLFGKALDFLQAQRG
ncbi:MAG: hypothetical protein ABEJ26_02245 [Halosimplex sp.]